MTDLLQGWTTLAAGALDVSEVTRLLLGVAVLLGAARLLGEVAAVFRQPAVLGEILAGVLLGKTVLGGLFPGMLDYLYPAAGNNAVALSTLTTVAVTLLLLVAGMEVDLTVVARQGKAALTVSLSGIVFPFVIGFTLAYLAPRVMGMDPQGQVLPFALFIGIAMSITALPVIAKIMLDLSLFRSDLGMLIMSAAMVDDLIGWLGFAAVLATISGNGSAGGVGVTLLLTLGFVVLMLTLGRAASHRMLPYLQAHLTWPGGVLAYILVAALLSAAFTEWVGVHAIFGAFIAGVTIGASRHLRQHTRQIIHQFVTNLFAPLFFASIGLQLNFAAAFDPVLVAVVLVVAIAVKVGGCYAGARMASLSPRESVAIGFGMSARGAMEIVLAQLARQAELITDRLFVAIVVMALATSLLSGPVMSRLLLRTTQRRLRDFLGDKLFIPRLRATDSRDAITKLTTRAAEVSGLPAAPLFNAAWEREQIASNGIGDQVAVPHARVAGLSKPLLVLGLDADGVDFNAPDGKAATIICLLLTPLEDPGSQLELLALVARSFHDAAIRSAVMEAQSYTELLAALSLADAAAKGH